MDTYENKVVACTGHRPAKLGGYSERVFLDLVALAVHTFSRLKPSLVIVGGAQGWDQACAQACNALGIPFDLYIPFEGYDSKWPLEAQIRASEIHSTARRTIIVSPATKYHPSLLHQRNEAMVDDCELVLSLFSGDPEGGTARCVDYANSRGKVVLNVWERWIRKNY